MENLNPEMITFFLNEEIFIRMIVIISMKGARIRLIYFAYLM